MMGQAKGSWLTRLTMGLLAAVWLCAALVFFVRAQEETRVGYLTITDNNVDSFPSVELQAYGMDGQGVPLDLSTEPLFVSHNNFPADFVTFEGRQPVGTLTVFLIDTPTGVADQLPAIQEAILQYAGPGAMQEQLDAIAVYQIGPDGPRELLAPTTFYNAVKNLFATPLAAESGATALVDSTVALLERTPSLKPNPAMAASIVLISDGTDAVSTQAQPADVPLQASAAGIPIHTILLNNPELGGAGQEIGRQYMVDVASGSRGIATTLSDPSGLASIWNRIGGFREQARVRYTAPEPASGTFPVILSLDNNRDVSATTEVTVMGSVPSVTLNVPEESRSMSLPSLEQAVDLRLGATVSWLDGVQRQVTEASLLVNDVPVSDIPVDRLEQFDVSVSNMIFGDNRLQVVVKDDQNLQAASPPVIITVEEGEVSVPEALQPAGNRTWLYLLLALLGFALLGGLLYWLWRRDQSKRTSRRRRAQPQSPAGEDRPPSAQAYPIAPPGEPAFVMAHLEVLEAQTLMLEDDLNLASTLVRIGRSPVQSDVAFRDDITVSRLHASLRLEGSHYRLYDEGSTSGSFVNGQRVAEYGMQLIDGDEIQLGAVRLRYRQL